MIGYLLSPAGVNYKNQPQNLVNLLDAIEQLLKHLDKSYSSKTTETLFLHRVAPLYSLIYRLLQEQVSQMGREKSKIKKFPAYSSEQPVACAHQQTTH